MKAIKCRLILHGTCRQLDGGIHDSKSAAKKWASECWNKPYTIIPLKPEPQPEPQTKLDYWGAMERVRQLAQMDGEAY